MTNPTITNHDPTGIILGNNEYEEVTILTTQVLAAGSVLGLITASQKAQLVVAAAVDGSEVARYVLTKPADSTGGDIVFRVLKSGLVRESKLIFGSTDNIATEATNSGSGQVQTHKENLRDFGILTEPKQYDLHDYDNQP